MVRRLLQHPDHLMDQVIGAGGKADFLPRRQFDLDQFQRIGLAEENLAPQIGRLGIAPQRLILRRAAGANPPLARSNSAAMVSP